MAHVRQQIREAVASAVTGLTITGARVFMSRVYPHDASALPGLTIYSTAETSEPDTMSRPRGITRELTVAIEARAKAGSDVDDSLDSICAQVEAVLGANVLAGLVKDLRLVSTEIELSGESDKPVGLARMSWVAEYRTVENDATVAQ